MKNSIMFKSITCINEGDLCDMLQQCYSPMRQNKNFWDEESGKWKQFDVDVFGNSKTIGACVYISTVNNEIIGFCSYDPRKKPLAIIGHNCILPKFQNKEYGTEQMSKLLKILKEKGFTKVNVTTGTDKFFTPAQRMYNKCGFKKEKRSQRLHKDNKVLFSKTLCSTR